VAAAFVGMRTENMPNIELKDIQGLIMSGYGHLDHGTYIFLHIPNSTHGKAWLREVTPFISTSEVWPKGSDGKVIKPESAVTVGFTAAGLKALALPNDAMDTFPLEFREGITDPQRSPILGDTGDSMPEKWDIGGREPEKLHLMLVILAQDANVLAAVYQHHQALWEKHALEQIALLEGARLEASKEHFGWFDGVSQPKIESGVRDPKASEPTIKTGEFIMGYENEYGQTPESPRLDGKDLGRNGTYIVFRKLYQDVAAFWNYVASNIPSDEDSQMQIRAMADDDKQVWLASKFLGRWPSGTPMVLAPFKDDPSIDRAQMNTFLYRKRDPRGEQIPLGSHIRRTNPRDSLPPNEQESLKMSDRHLIIRRGLPYGKPLFPLTILPPGKLEDDGADRGLVFLCVNANIKRQFEFIQQTWANNPKFHGLHNDKDPILGDNDSKGDHTIQRDPARRRLTGIPRFVQVKGGGYFFVPSITALKLLSTE